MKKMKKMYVAFVIVLAIIVPLGLLAKSTARQIARNNKRVPITVSFYPLAAFTKAVGGQFVDIMIVVPPGSAPHDIDPTVQQIRQIEKSRIFIYNGAGFEKWADKILPVLKERQVRVVDASRGIELIKSQTDGQLNPHFWIDPLLAIKEVQNITAQLKEEDPAHADEYIKNSVNYIQKLNELDARIQTELKLCKKKDVVVSHDAFGYIAKRYNLNIIPISGISPEEEPSLKRLAEISQIVLSRDVKYIFFESLVNRRLSDTIAQETGAGTLVFNPVEGLTKEELAAGKDYFSIQQENFHNLHIALECN